MGLAYTPGLEVTETTTVLKVRELPLAGKVLVKVGDRVQAETPVLSADLPGELVVLRIADQMGVEPADAIRGLRVKVGDHISRGDLVSTIKTFFGLFTAEAKSTVDGIVEFLTEANAHLGIRPPPSPLTIAAYIEGEVVEIREGRSATISSSAALIQGVFGVGGERQGKITPLAVEPTEIVTAAHLNAVALSGTVLIGGMSFSRDALKQAANAGAAAVLTGSVTAELLREYVGTDIGVSITGDERVPTTLIVSEGFGQIPLSPRIQALAAKFTGQKASVNGATQVRAGAMRPEIIIPHSTDKGVRHLYGFSEMPAKTSDTVIGSGRALESGSRIRLIRVPYFGQTGTVTALPSEPTQIDTGAHVRVLKAKLDNGTEVTVPRANVELL